MTYEIQSLIFGAIIGLIIGFLVAKLTIHSAVKNARSNSVKQSRSVILGDVNEKLAPALPGFPYDFKDMVFIGKGIDYLVFDGLASGHLRKIILLEIKSGNSLLNRNESMIKSTVLGGYISYEVFRVHV